MSRIVCLVAACGLALIAVPTRAEDPLTDEQKAINVQKVLTAKVKFTGSDIDGCTLSEVLGKLGKEHGIEFVIREEEFAAVGGTNVKDRKSHFRHLDTTGLTVPQFLDAWLASVGATYKPERARIAIVPAPRWNEKAGEFDRPDRNAVALTALEYEVFWGDKNLNEVPLFELLQDMSKKYQITFLINENSFKQAGIMNIKEEKPNITATQLRGLSVRQFLNVTLDGVGATYLVKNGMIEIVHPAYAAKVTKSALLEDTGERVQLKEPLVSVILKEKPLNEAVAKLAEMYDLNVVVAPQAGDARTGFVTARLLNVPADKALELLALQCDLRVVRRGNAFLITNRDHANDLFDESIEKEKKKLEIQKLREAAKPPEAPVKPVVPPGTEKMPLIPPGTEKPPQ